MEAVEWDAVGMVARPKKIPRATKKAKTRCQVRHSRCSRPPADAPLPVPPAHQASLKCPPPAPPPPPATAQVEGCLSKLLPVRSFFPRQHICEKHFKAAAITDASGRVVRYCQQCTKLQPLVE